MVVVSPLTSEAILGIDFLPGQQAVIDLGCGRLCPKESGCEIPLDATPQTLFCTHSQSARTFETVEVPPCCVMEVSAHLETAVEGVWLVERNVSGASQLAVARALVQPTSTTIPVCILNTSDEPATLYTGAVIAVLEPIEPPAEVDAVVDTTPEISNDKREMLWQLVQDILLSITRLFRCDGIFNFRSGPDGQASSSQRHWQLTTHPTTCPSNFTTSPRGGQRVSQMLERGG